MNFLRQRFFFIFGRSIIRREIPTFNFGFFLVCRIPEGFR